MIVACFIYITVLGMPEGHYVTGRVNAEYGLFFNVDVQNAVDGIKGSEGNYSNYLVQKDYCSTGPSKIKGKL